MPSFGKKSLEKRAQLHHNLQQVVDYAIQKIDFSIIEGYRGKEAQDKAFTEGKSKVQFPESKHNKVPSEAFDFIPYPLKDWEDLNSFDRVIDIILECAKQLNIQVRAGRDFTSLKDYPHIELV